MWHYSRLRQQTLDTADAERKTHSSHVQFTAKCHSHSFDGGGGGGASAMDSGVEYE